MTTHELDPKTIVRPIRVLLGSLTFGMLSFTAVAIFVNLGGDGLGNPSAGTTRIFGWVLAAVGAALFAAARFVDRIRPKPELVAGIDADEGAARRVAAFWTHTIVKGAFAEAFGLLGGVFYMVTAALPFLAAPALAIGVLLRLFPSEGTIRALLRDPGPGDGGTASPIAP